MRKGVDYKLKYEQLRAKYIQSLDQAFRMGFQQGVERGQIDAQQQAQQAQAEQMAQQQQQMAAQGQDPNAMPGQDPGVDPSQDPGMDPAAQAEGQQAASELDAKIGELEQAMMGKAETTEAELSLLKSLREQAQALRKSFDVSAIKLGNLASANLDANDKASLSRQQQIIDSCLKKWEDEARQATSSIVEVVNGAKRS